MQGSVRVVLSFPNGPQLLQGQMTCIYMYIYKSLHTYQFRSTFIPQEIAKTAPRTSLLRFACILHISYTNRPYIHSSALSRQKTYIHVLIVVSLAPSCIDSTSHHVVDICMYCECSLVHDDCSREGSSHAPSTRHPPNVCASMSSNGSMASTY